MDKKRRVPLNLGIEADLVQRIKIQAVKDGRTVSEITEGLFREYLKQSRQKGKPKKGGK